MPHPVVLSDDTFAKLQKLAKPFIDTPESVIAELADEEISRRFAAEAPRRVVDDAIHIEPDQHASLTHARLLSATVDGRALHRPKWNGLHHHLHTLARQRLGSFDALRRVSPANLRDGKYEEDGFQYIPEANMSIQGVEANSAWDNSLALARHLRISIEVRFEWRLKEGAAHPGKSASIQWSPPSLSVA